MKRHRRTKEELIRTGYYEAKAAEKALKAELRAKGVKRVTKKALAKMQADGTNSSSKQTKQKASSTKQPTTVSHDWKRAGGAFWCEFRNRSCEDTDCKLWCTQLSCPYYGKGYLSAVEAAGLPAHKQ